MNRTDRLLAIILELQGKGRQRAEDLARTFETSKRTIYRDIQALGESGVPLISTPGYGYSLMAGYFLPPLSFTTEEALMLLLGSDFTAQSFDAHYRAASQSASRKIEGVLPANLREDVHDLQHSLRFLSYNADTSPTREKLQQLRRAIIERRTVSFHYSARHSGSGAQTSREADPYGLVNVLGFWNVVAYCHLRHDIRNFRLDRIDDLTLLQKTFQRPADFQLQTHKPDMSSRTLVVRALFDFEVSRWVHESRFYYVTAEEETADGLLVTLVIRQESEVLQWLLSWGRHVYVLEPATLRQQLVEEAQAMLCNYQKKLE